jgi:hypothetical protein
VENEKENQEEIEENQEERKEEEEQMEQEEEQKEKELSNEEIKHLLQNKGEVESKYIIELSEWNRPGNSFNDYGKIIVLEGRIRLVEKEHIYSYPTTNQYDYFVIPLTRVVILKHVSENDYEGDTDHRETLYVFSATEGWRSLRL